MQDREWSWVSEDGTEYQGGQHQLTGELSSERLPAWTLVSRIDWRDWLPAMQVSELQWAIPPSLVDSPRSPTPRLRGPKLPPPLAEYPDLRERALELLRRPPSQVDLSPRPLPSAPLSAAAYDLHQYGEDDFDEPTVQIDAEQLERALNQSRAEEPDPNRPPTLSPPSPDASSEVDGPLHRMPTFPGSGYVPNRATPALPTPAPPALSQPSHAPHAAPPALNHANGTPDGASRVPLSSSIDDSPQFRRSRGKVTLVMALAVSAGLSAAWLLGRDRQRSDERSPPPVSLPVALPQAPQPSATPRCAVEKDTQLSDFAHVQVPTIARPITDTGRIAVGFAQTSRLAVGLAVEPSSLAVDRIFTETQSSPLWSVVPVPASEPAFRTNRAASTLRSTTTIPSDPPLAFGLSRDGLAVRGPTDAVDRVLWKTDSDTSTVPDVHLTTQQSYVVALRAGGERGQILLGRIGPDGSAQGELQPIAGLDGRVDIPSLFATEQHTYLVVSGGQGAHKDKLYVATSPASSLPDRATVVRTVSEGITSARLTALGDHLLLQYTEGTTGHQRVVGQVLDDQLAPRAEAFQISPPGRDAYEGVVVTHGDNLLSLFFVRHEQGHELWMARIRCL